MTVNTDQYLKEQAILNRAYDDTAKAFKNVTVDASGNSIDQYELTSNYEVNHVDDYTTTSVTYVGKEDRDGVWWIMKIDESGNFPVITHATVTNNASLTSYSAAWTARVTATYGVFSTAF